MTYLELKKEIHKMFEENNIFFEPGTPIPMLMRQIAIHAFYHEAKLTNEQYNILQHQHFSLKMKGCLDYEKDF